MPKEKYDKNLIDYYTSKEYKELRDLPQELSTLINTLKESPVYLKYHNTYISKTKLLFEDSGKLYNEIPCLIILNEINKKAYLLPYEFSKDDNNNIRTFADSLKEDIFTDFKRVFSLNIHNAVERGLNQGQDLFILVNNNSINRERIKERLTDYERKRK